MNSLSRINQSSRTKFFFFNPRWYMTEENRLCFSIWQDFGSLRGDLCQLLSLLDPAIADIFVDVDV